MKLYSSIAIQFALRARAAAVLRAVSPERVQPHSRRLPTEAEIDQARAVARQFEAMADDFAAGLVDGGLIDNERQDDDE